MNKKITKGLSLLLLVVILLSSVPSFAATFPDVKPDYWAYSHIEKMVKLGMIKGHEDGTFKPKDNVTYLENLQMISGLITMTKEELNAGKMAYGSLLSELKIATWAQDAVVKCLYRGVISEAELREAEAKGLTATGTKFKPARLTISIYLAKAMGLEELANSKPVVSLPYKESLQIEGKYHRLLATLIDIGVLNPEGTGGGYFEPNAFVQRDAIAKMLSTGYDYLQKNPVKPVEKEEVTIRGTVSSVLSDAVRTYVTVKDRSNNDKAYFIEAKTKITVDNRTGTKDDIVKGQDIELTTLKDDLVVISLNVTSIEEDIKGIVKSISTSTNKIVIEDERDKAKTTELSVDKNTNILVNDKKGTLSDIKAGDSVAVIARNKLALDIEAKSKIREIEGTIKEIVKDTKGTTITHFIKITNAKDEVEEYEIDPKAYINRNKRSAVIEDLKLGDKVILELEYDLVIEIDANVVIKKVEGHITGINTRVSQGTMITMRNRETNKDEEYVLAKDVYIRIDNVVANSYDLKINYYANIVVEGNEIVEVFAESRSSNSSIIGKITSIDPRRNQFTISVDSFGQDGYTYGDLINVYTKADVIVRDINAINLEFKDLRKGDTVNIIGIYDGAVFAADIIMLLK